MLRTIILSCIFAVAVCAADVSGKWNVTAVAPDGREYKLELSLKQEGGKWTGTMSSERGSVALEDVQVAGDGVSYKLPVGEVDYQIKLAAADGSLKGTFTGPDGTTGQVKAVRSPEGSAVSVAGKWKLIATPSSGNSDMNLVLDLANDGGRLTGSIGPEEGGSVPISDANLKGNELTFKVTIDEGTYELKLTVSENSLKGSYKGPEGRSGTLSGKR